MKRCVFGFLLAVVVAIASPAFAADETLLGFPGERSREQRDLESRFDGTLNAENLRQWMSHIAARPHHVGSEWGKQNAEFMAELFRSWGYETRIETFEVLFPTPKLRRLQMIEPVVFTASLEEPALAEDATSGQKDEQLPTYNAYSVDGDVTAELVYVNYGVPEDYEELARRGIDVEGKIALARYGKSWRGIKPKVAAENGAIGCIIYSDPRDDGYFLGDVYPVGGYRGAASAQRGSVADMPLFPGDPLTPGRGATADADRLKIEDAPTLTSIPVLPISYADAQPLLEALGGPVAPPSWRGALPLAYHLGPGPAKVRLQLEFDWKMATARDVIAVLPGKTSPDQWVIRGNHHDAWVNGAADPVAGLVAMMEEARAVAELTKNGWRPRRTIVYAAWDAEEPGLLGSVEWAEAHADELRRKAVAYINTDAYGRGFLQMGGSHTLERFMNQVTRDVPDPRKEMSVAQRRRAAILVNGNDEAKKEARERADLRLDALGSGSDYTPFLQHLGIASLNLSFFGEGHYGQYHSVYDSFDHFTRFMDPDFRYGVALAKVAGRTTLRLADADVLPFEFATLVETIAGYVDELQKLADEMREKTAEKNRLIDEGSYVAAANPEETYVPPQREEPVPHLNFAPLENALESLRSSVQTHEEALTAARAEDGELPPEKAAALDSVLMSVERSLGRSEGLPGRSWYTHHVYAPGFYTGYGVKTLPGVREAIELRQWSQVEGQIAVAAAVLAALDEQVERATEILAR
jgi:N-acetylated-alpha-linked acidic dipeptidase